MEKERFTLDQKSFKKIIIGANIAMGGALLTYVAMVVGKYDFGVWTPIVVALGGILVNIGRKFIAKYKTSE